MNRLKFHLFSGFNPDIENEVNLTVKKIAYFFIFNRLPHGQNVLMNILG